MSQEDGYRKTAFQTRQLLFKKIQGFRHFFHPSIDTICKCMSCAFLPSEGENADKLSHADKQRKNLAAFCYLNKDTFLSQYITYQTNAKMWANQSSELTE